MAQLGLLPLKLQSAKAIPRFAKTEDHCKREDFIGARPTLLPHFCSNPE